MESKSQLRVPLLVVGFTLSRQVSCRVLQRWRQTRLPYSVALVAVCGGSVGVDLVRVLFSVSLVLALA